MDNSKESDWIEIFTELMKLHYQEIEISEKSNFKQDQIKRQYFKIDSGRIQFYFYEPDINKYNFYFEVDPELERKIKNRFKNPHCVPHLGFEIKFGSNNMTYSYLKFEKYLGNYMKNIFMQASYMFACVNYCIKLYDDTTK
jgi:hypothetical protein